MRPLDIYRCVYECLVKVLLKKNSQNDLDIELTNSGFLSTFAWMYHPGLFVDLRLEYWALSIGKELAARETKVSKVSGNNIKRPVVVHVATEVYNIGGHTKFLLNLIKNDNSSIHSLVVTSQEFESIPEWLIKEICNTGGTVKSLYQKSLIARVKSLQNILQFEASKIFYHIHPNDSVAVAALAIVPRPAVLAINHADHVFWLGSTLVDSVICIREWSKKFSLDYRAARHVNLLPIPLNFKEVEVDYKRIARQELKIAEDTILLLTVASFYKFIPSGQYNYFETISNFLKNNPSVIVKLIGIDNSDDLKKLQYQYSARIELLGIVPNPKIYYMAADIYLDSMPFSSFTSLFEAMYFECFPILQYNPVDTLYIENETVYKGLIKHARTSEEQLVFMQQAVDNPLFRKNKARQCSQRIKQNYMMPGWNKYLEEVYRDNHETVTSIPFTNVYSKNSVETRDNVEAAELANSFYNLNSEELLIMLRNILHSLSLSDIINIGIELKKHQSNTGISFSIRQISWLLRAKFKSRLKSQAVNINKVSYNQ